MAYMYFNLVKHGYVERSRDWLYSSFARVVEAGWYRRRIGVRRCRFR
jgi:hypothetical protein